MTAMFVVIFLEQWKKDTRHFSALLGLGASAVCLALWGPDGFMLPAMLSILACLLLLRKPMEQEVAQP